MTRKVTIADFGAGNLLSVARAFHACGADVIVSSSPAVLKAADRLVVPGVGAFADSMRGLRERRLAEVITSVAVSRPTLGICVGMQMLFEASEEFGRHDGLGLIPGMVSRIPATGVNGLPHKIPHIGWSPLWPGPEQDWEGTILAGIPAGAAVYFVHSYTAHPACKSHRLANADYDGCPIAGVVTKGLLSGCQFHPEKSGTVGLAILGNFLRL